MQPRKSNPSASFKDFLLDALQKLEDLHVRPLFGGFGFYLGNAFFGIIWKGRLFFKTDAQTRNEYLALGAVPFDPPRPHRTKPVPTYYSVPEVIFNNPERLRAWAIRSAQTPHLTSRKRQRIKTS